MKLYCYGDYAVRERSGAHLRLDGFSIDELFRQVAPAAWLTELRGTELESFASEGASSPPLESQEVWAAGVTYSRSREARKEESEREADIYERVYDAKRPELFFKATPHRVVGTGASLRLRRDSHWNVPEAELALAVNADGAIFGYTIGNDMSSRSIEGDNPLYLSQAKIWDTSCALGPCLWIPDRAPEPVTEIVLSITRAGRTAFQGRTRLSSMKRSAEELVNYLFLECSFPNGVFLLTGTGIVPEAAFSLASGDVIEIEISELGTLVNRVE